MKKLEQRVPNLRFKGFTDDWEQRKLGDVVNFFSGLTYHPSDVKNKGYFVIRSSNIQNNQIVSADDIFVNKDIINVPNVKQGDIIVVVRNGSRKLIGKHAQVLTDMPNTVIGAFMTGVRSKSNFYINALLDSDQFQKEIYKNLGATINQITIGEFRKMRFIITSGNEAQTIGEFFKKIDTLITLQQRKLDLLKQFKKGLLQKMFADKDSKRPVLRFKGFHDDWEQRKVSDIFTVTRGQVLATTKISEVKTNEMCFPVYSSQTKNNGLMGYYNKYLFNTAITWTTDGANAGTVNYREGKFYSTNVNGVLLSDDGYANKAIAEILDRVAWRHVSRVGNPKLMNNVMSNIKISIPSSFEEQNAISEFLIKFDHLIVLHQRKQNHLKLLKKSLLQQMFM